MKDIEFKEKLVLLVNELLKLEVDFEAFRQYYEYLEEKFTPKVNKNDGYFVRLEDASSSLKVGHFENHISLKEETREEKILINNGKVQKILDILKGMKLDEISFILEDVGKTINFETRF